jgi:hypothetical protein
MCQKPTLYGTWRDLTGLQRDVGEALFAVAVRDLAGEFSLVLRIYRLTEESPCLPELLLKRWNPLAMIPWFFAIIPIALAASLPGHMA